MQTTGNNDWEAATRRIINSLMHPDADSVETELPLGLPDLAENWARTFVEENPDRDLRLALPALWAVTSAAGEGAFYTRMPGENYTVPLILHFIGLAPSGSGKTSLIERLDPLIKQGLAAGRRWRLEWAREALGKLRAAAGPDTPLDDQVATGILKPASCHDTLTGSGTPEGLRDNLVAFGGHRFIFTDEADALQELSLYSNRGPSITILCRGWDQGDISVDRAAKDGKLNPISIPKASLPLMMLVQPSMFNSCTAEDVWDNKGALSRMLLMPGKDSDVPEDYVPHKRSSQAELELDLEDVPSIDWPVLIALRSLSERGSVYRARKAVDRQLEKVQDTLADVDLIAEYLSSQPLGSVQLGWDQAGIAVHSKVQQMRLDILRAVQAKTREDGVEPPALPAFGARFTQHVYRVAMARTLLENPAAGRMSADIVADTAVRVMPWLVAGWAQVMAGRAGEAQDAAVEKVFQRNPRGQDQSPQGLLLRTLGNGKNEAGEYAPGLFAPAAVFMRKEILDKVSRMGGRNRTAVRQVCAAVFDQMVESGDWVDTVKTGRKTVAGQETVAYRLTRDGVAVARAAAGLDQA